MIRVVKEVEIHTTGVEGPEGEEDRRKRERRRREGSEVTARERRKSRRARGPVSRKGMDWENTRDCGLKKSVMR